MSRPDNGFLFSLLLMKKIEADKRRKKEQWRKNAVDGDYYDIDPQEYESEEEYLSALDYAKYGWRDQYPENDHVAGIDPYEYETEDEYLSALEDQYGWRDYYRGDWRTVKLDPDEYETEDEYLEARYGWRKNILKIVRS